MCAAPTSTSRHKRRRSRRPCTSRVRVPYMNCRVVPPQPCPTIVLYSRCWHHLSRLPEFTRQHGAGGDEARVHPAVLRDQAPTAWKDEVAVDKPRIGHRRWRTPVAFCFKVDVVMTQAPASYIGYLYELNSSLTRRSAGSHGREFQLLPMWRDRWSSNTSAPSRCATLVMGTLMNRGIGPAVPLALHWSSVAYAVVSPSGVVRASEVILNRTPAEVPVRPRSGRADGCNSH